MNFDFVDKGSQQGWPVRCMEGRTTEYFVIHESQLIPIHFNTNDTISRQHPGIVPHQRGEPKFRRCSPNNRHSDPVKGFASKARSRIAVGSHSFKKPTPVYPSVVLPHSWDKADHNKRQRSLALWVSNLCQTVAPVQNGLPTFTQPQSNSRWDGRRPCVPFQNRGVRAFDPGAVFTPVFSILSSCQAHVSLGFQATHNT